MCRARGARARAARAREHVGSVTPAEAHDPANELPVDEVRDSSGSVNAAAIAEPASQHAEQARASAPVDEDDRVGGRQAFVERTESHRVDHPRLPREQHRLDVLPFRAVQVAVDQR